MPTLTRSPRSPCALVLTPVPALALQARLATFSSSPPRRTCAEPPSDAAPPSLSHERCPPPRTCRARRRRSRAGCSRRAHAPTRRPRPPSPTPPPSLASRLGHAHRADAGPPHAGRRPRDRAPPAAFADGCARAAAGGGAHRGRHRRAQRRRRARAHYGAAVCRCLPARRRWRARRRRRRCGGIDRPVACGDGRGVLGGGVREARGGAPIGGGGWSPESGLALEGVSACSRGSCATRGRRSSRPSTGMAPRRPRAPL